MTTEFATKMNSSKDKDQKHNTKKINNKTQKANAKKVKGPPDSSRHSKTNSTRSSVSNSKSNISSNTNNEKVKDVGPTTKTIQPPANEQPPKFERSNSFSITRRLSKLINSFTGSKENISKPDADESSYKFTRSRSMILLRRPNRRSAIEPQLEQLSEETEKSNQSTDGKPKSPATEPAEENYTFKKPLEPPKALTNPQANFQKRRSSSFIASFRKSFVGTTEKKKPLNPKWSASLQSLQAIDNMVSYENMKFIDYDKFHDYEKDLERRLSTIHLESVEDISPIPLTPPPVPVVVRRPKNEINAANGSVHRKLSSSLASYSDFEVNLDKPKSVYRHSLDSRKLEHLDHLSRGSLTWNTKFDALNLDNCSIRKSERSLSFPSGSTVTLRRIRSTSDVVDSPAAIQLKSKSLTHLDGLDSIVTCHGANIGTKSRPISSSEFFSVSFCMDNGCQEEEFIPVIKGVTLIEALGNTLRRRNLSFSKIFITDNNLPNFWESGSPPYTSSFDENTDIESLAGRNLLITDRDGKKPLQKAASFGSRTRPPRLLSSASTEETTESEQRTIPGKQLKQRWSGLFGVKNPHQNQLCELLNGYAKNGVPQKSTPFSFDHPDLDVALVYLDQMHSSWKDFIPCDNMSDNDTKIQTAIWELVTTEVYYIHALQTVTDLFLACLEAIQEENLLTDVDQHKLFSNVRDICEANLKFWTFYLFPMVAHSVANHVPLCIDFFRQGFVTFATTFAPYKKYCAEQSTCQFYCKELNQNNSLFTAYLAWCESQKMCNRLRLADILVRPMQRLTKYNLLLNAIRRHVIDEDDADAIDEMIHSVENFVCSVNNHLTTRQENERLKGVMARIECYEVVDTKDENLERLVKQHSAMFDLCAPMKGCPSNQVRHLFMEGDHKFKDNLGKADVHCFLLTDILLICKTIAKKGLGALKVIRQPYLTDRLVVHHHGNTLNCIYLNEFQVATTAFILQCSEAKNWYESLKRAKHIYTRLKQNTSNNWETYRYPSGGISGGTVDSLGVKKSPINSSICSHVTSANNSHSGSVEWNDSRNISVDFEKTNSLSSDEGSGVMSTNAGQVGKMKTLATSPHKHKMITSSNTLSVQPINHLGQSLPNLHLHHNQTNLYHTYSNNTLLVPGSTGNQSSNLLSPSHRGISYPPPSPTRATLRRGMAFSSSIKNPPLVKTRNITSQSSINWHQIPATPTPTSPQSQLQQSSSSSTSQNVPAPPTTPSAEQLPLTPSSDRAAQFANQGGSENTSLNVSSTETDV